MVANIMIASVQERKRDISTLSAIGLSPLHVSSMFLAESVIYAVVGGLLGYFAAMSIVSILKIFNLMQITLNYSSSWVVTVIGLAMLMTVIPTLYPLRLASKLVTPSLERAWTVPTKPKGDRWTIPLPFVFTTQESSGICAFLAEFFREHAIERAEIFSVKALSYSEEFLGKEINTKRLKMEVQLAPYEQGIGQTAQIILKKDVKTGRWSIEIFLERKRGRREMWEKSNRNFIDQIRKQLLIWRSLTTEERRLYIKKARELTKSGGMLDVE